MQPVLCLVEPADCGPSTTLPMISSPLRARLYRSFEFVKSLRSPMSNVHRVHHVHEHWQLLCVNIVNTKHYPSNHSSTAFWACSRFRPAGTRRSRAVHHVVGDLLAAVGRQAVQHLAVRRGLRQQRRVHLERGELAAAAPRAPPPGPCSSRRRCRSRRPSRTASAGSLTSRRQLPCGRASGSRPGTASSKP